MWHDPFGVLCSVLTSVFVRLVLFVASLFLGGWAGFAAAAMIFSVPSGLVSSLSFCAALLASPAALAVLIHTESARIVCLALAINFLAWCWLGAFVAVALSAA